MQRCVVRTFAVVLSVLAALSAGTLAVAQPAAQVRGLQSTAPPETLIPKGNDYALLFATDTYLDPAWRDLRNPVRDATTIASELRQSYGFAEARVVQDPTLKQILDTLDEYLRRRTFADNDQLFIFFAGHGLYRSELDLGFIVAKDSRSPDADPANQTFLPFSMLYRYVDRIRAKHVFLVMDVCHGGTFAEAMTSRGDVPRSDYEDASHAERVSRIMQRTTRKFLTSGGNEYVPDGSGAHSPFAARFIDALRRRPADGSMTATEIFQAVRNVRPNQPAFGDFGQFEPVSDFIFVARSAAATMPARDPAVPSAVAARVAHVDLEAIGGAASGVKPGDPAVLAALRSTGSHLVFNFKDSGIIWSDRRLDLTNAIRRTLNDPRTSAAVDVAPVMRAAVVDLQLLADKSQLGIRLRQRVASAPASVQQDEQKKAQDEFQAALSPRLNRRAIESGLDAVFSLADSGILWTDPPLDVTAAVLRDLDDPAFDARPPGQPSKPNAARGFGYVNIQRAASESVLGKQSTARLQSFQSAKLEELQAAAGRPDQASRAQEAQKEQEALTARLQQEFQTELYPVLEALAKERGKLLIMSAADAGLIWASTDLDLTAPVIAALDKATAAKRR